MAWCGATWDNAARHDMTLYGMAWHDVVWCGVAWDDDQGMAWHFTTWRGVA